MMFFTRCSSFLVLLASSCTVAPHSLPANLLEELGHVGGTSELDHVEPERIVTYRWDGDRPDSHREPRWMHKQNVFVPLAASLYNKIRRNTALRTGPNEGKAKYSIPEDILFLLLKIAMQPADEEVNKPWELSMHHAVNYLNAEMKTSLEAKDVKFASTLRRLPQEVQTKILKRVSSVESLSNLFMELKPGDQLRKLVWQEMQLLSYFSQVDREVFRDLHRDDRFLSTVVQFHALQCRRSGSRAWSGGMAIAPISLSDELAKRIVPANHAPLADYFQDYDRFLNEGKGELKERLDRFLFTYVMSGSGNFLKDMHYASTLASKIAKLPTGWWLTSSQNLIEGQVNQLVKELIESLHSDFITVAMALRQQRVTSPRSSLHFLYPTFDPAHNVIGRQAIILGRFQAAQHLCKYSGVNFDQIFLNSIEDSGHVQVWLRALAEEWSRANYIHFRAASPRYLTPTG